MKYTRKDPSGVSGIKIPARTRDVVIQRKTPLHASGFSMVFTRDGSRQVRNKSDIFLGVIVK